MEKEKKAWILIALCWVIALIATLGSLFFSEVMGFPPCSLCWYQRIAMYPLVVLFFIGLNPLQKTVFKYTFPMVCIGWLTALYHNLLHLKIIPESLSPCRLGVPCSSIWIKWLGFITIPVLSFSAFSLLLILLITFYKKHYR
jgi:disulfide bond formation protein DsbB